MSTGQPELAAGLVLDGKWRLDGVLGSGGMGTVYAATHLRNGREVALKLLHPDVARDPAARERFLHEGYAANKVGHPGTVQVLDDGIAPQGAFLVMERLRGSTIDHMAEERGQVLPLPLVVSVLRSVLEVVAHGHAASIVHRDLKPENWFLTTDGRLKVLDFGLARVREIDGGMRLTATGVPMGTPAFMPPEQALAHWDRVGPASDVFSIGASAFTLLSGRLIHEARSAPEMLVLASTRQVVPISSVVPQIPAPIAAVIDRSLRLAPEERFVDAGQMLAALDAATSQVGFAAPALGTVTMAPTTAAVPRTASAISASQATMASGPNFGTGTVSPTTTDPSRRTQRRVSAGLVVGLSAALGVALAVIGALVLVGPDGSNKTNAAGAGSGVAPGDPVAGADPVGSAEPGQIEPPVVPAATTAEPLATAQPSAIPTSSASAAPTTTAVKVRPGPGPRPPPTSNPGSLDPLGNYKGN